MAKAKTTILLDAEVLRAAKRRAVDLGIALSRYFESLVERDTTPNEPRPRKEVVLRTHGKGGMHPGLSLEDKDKIEEIELKEWLSSM